MYKSILAVLLGVPVCITSTLNEFKTFNRRRLENGQKYSHCTCESGNFKTDEPQEGCTKHKNCCYLENGAFWFQTTWDGKKNGFGNPEKGCVSNILQTRKITQKIKGENEQILYVAEIPNIGNVGRGVLDEKSKDGTWKEKTRTTFCRPLEYKTDSDEEKFCKDAAKQIPLQKKNQRWYIDLSLTVEDLNNKQYVRQAVCKLITKDRSKKIRCKVE